MKQTVKNKNNNNSSNSLVLKPMAADKKWKRQNFLPMATRSNEVEFGGLYKNKSQVP